MNWSCKKNTSVQEDNDKLRKEFAKHANSFHAWLTETRQQMMETSGTLEEQLDSLKVEILVFFFNLRFNCYLQVLKYAMKSRDLDPISVFKIEQLSNVSNQPKIIIE